MDGLRVMQADVENQHMVQSRGTGKSLGLGGSGAAAGACKPPSPLFGKARKGMREGEVADESILYSTYGGEGILLVQCSSMRKGLLYWPHWKGKSVCRCPLL